MCAMNHIFNLKSFEKNLILISNLSKKKKKKKKYNNYSLVQIFYQLFYLHKCLQMSKNIK